ncbi:hypothetical protein [Glaciimonas sp. PCH181]
MPAASLASSLLIGLASALFVLFNGKIAGISGIVNTTVTNNQWS